MASCITWSSGAYKQKKTGGRIMFWKDPKCLMVTSWLNYIHDCLSCVLKTSLLLHAHDCIRHIPAAIPYTLQALAPACMLIVPDSYCKVIAYALVSTQRPPFRAIRSSVNSQFSVQTMPTPQHSVEYNTAMTASSGHSANALHTTLQLSLTREQHISYLAS